VVTWERVLFDALSDRVAVRLSLSIDTVRSTDDRVTVTLTDGTRQRADLLVGVDGIYSRVRQLVFGAEQRFLRYLGYHTAAYVFADRYDPATERWSRAGARVPSGTAPCVPTRRWRSGSAAATTPRQSSVS
jgi:2-polyprenyl-6-methoxyphenol hydroxylase-like FAD-dependent oxidoreductase